MEVKRVNYLFIFCIQKKEQKMRSKAIFTARENAIFINFLYIISVIIVFKSLFHFYQARILFAKDWVANQIDIMQIVTVKIYLIHASVYKTKKS